MTREEAIDIIKAERECVYRQGRTGECCRDDVGCGACDLVQEDTNIMEAYDMAIEALKERQHGECNQCRYYDGVHGVPGHAPCWHWNIGGVMWNDYCSRFEKEGGSND